MYFYNFVKCMFHDFEIGVYYNVGIRQMHGNKCYREVAELVESLFRSSPVIQLIRFLLFTVL